jgi:hypothetical protein
VSECDHDPPGVLCWIDIAQAEPEKALDFYGAVLGWDFLGSGSMPGDPPARYYVARLRGKDVAGISSLLPAGALAATRSRRSHVWRLAGRAAQGREARLRAIGLGDEHAEHR